MQFQVPYAHIWYGNSNTVYSEGVRAVTTYPPLLPVTFLHYIQDQGQGYAHIIHKKIMLVYYILCVLWYAYYEDVQSIEIPTIVHL